MMAADHDSHARRVAHDWTAFPLPSAGKVAAARALIALGYHPIHYTARPMAAARALEPPNATPQASTR